MNSLFSDDHASIPDRSQAGELSVPDEVRTDLGLLLDWYTPTIFVCWIILGINVIVFAAMLLSGFNPDHATPQILLKWGADYGPATITRGEWWRILTSTFVHLGFLHVFFNMMVLAQIGPFMERILGNAAFLLVYLVSGITGALCSLAWDPYMYSAGASGAIFGLYGALIGFLALRRDSIATEQLMKLLKGAGVFLVYNIIFGVLHSGTDIAAHAGGLLGGLICGLVISNPIDAGFKRRRIVRAAILGMTGVPAILAVGLILPRPMDFVKELTKFGAVEKKVMANHRAIMQQAGQAGAEDRTTAQRIRTEVLAPWDAERQTLARYKGLPGRQQKFLTAVVQYMDDQQRAWTKLAQSFESHNPTLLGESLREQMQAEQKLREAMPRLQQ